jgi:hypothetical protein
LAIDGRDIARARAEREAGGPVGRPAGIRDAYESPGVRIVSHAIVWVPVALVVWFAYVSGTWMGGPVAGLMSVGSTILSVGVLWLFMKRKKRAR